MRKISYKIIHGSNLLSSINRVCDKYNVRIKSVNLVDSSITFSTDNGANAELLRERFDIRGHTYVYWFEEFNDHVEYYLKLF